MTIEAITTVDTGEKSRYLFRKLMGGGVAVEMESRNATGYYPTKDIADFDKAGATAIRRLAESHAELRQFFDAMCKLGIFDHHGRLEGFYSPAEHVLDDERASAWEKVTETFEAIADFEGLEL